MSAALGLDGVHVGLGGRQVLRGLSVELGPGQIRAIVGLNGAGKTTALRVALGMLRPDAGRVYLHGQNIWPSRAATWRSVGHLVETPAAYPELTARENITHAGLLHWADPHRCRPRAQQLAQALGLGSQLDERVRRLSLGTRQKVGLVGAPAHEPRVAILDEPTNGLDPLAVVAFRDELRRLAGSGSSILITSHHFDELARIADQVDVLHGGRIFATITPDERDLEKVFFENGPRRRPEDSGEPVSAPAPVLRIECIKLFSSPVARTAALAVLTMVTTTSAGGYAAALHAPDSDMGRKANAMIVERGWAGYLGLTALSLGITLLLAGGIVTAWMVGREFTEGTVVGLFAIAASRASIARAKILACSAWGTGRVGLQSTISVLVGLALGLTPAGALGGWCTLATSGAADFCGVLPIAWVATQWRGFLAGIGATLAVLVVTNLASGFGAGPYVPWAIPTLWATPHANVPAAAMVIPVVVGLLGAWASISCWSRLQLGRG